MYPLLKWNVVLVKQYEKSYIYNLSRKENGIIVSSHFMYEIINKDATYILELCNGARKIEDIVKILSEKIKQKSEDIETIVDEFLQESVKKGYIEFREKPNIQKIKVLGDSESYTPFHAEFEITKKCPLKCLHCYNNSGNKKDDELSSDEIIKIMSDLKQSGVIKVALTGGEPTAKKGFTDICRYASENFLAVAVMSNGYLITEKILQEISECKNNTVFQISIDGNKEHHNMIRGVKDSYEKACNAITLLKKYGFKVAISSTFNKDNICDIEEITRTVKELGAMQITYGLTMDVGRAASNELANQLNVEEFYSITLKMKKEYSSINFFVNVSDEVGGKAENVSYKNNCGLGLNQIAIRENGDVSPCVCFFYSMGNLKKNKLSQILTKDVGNTIKDLMSPNFYLCHECTNGNSCTQCMVGKEVNSMEQSSSYDEKRVMHQFDRKCKLALKGEIVDYERHLAYLRKHETLFSELSEQEMESLSIFDEYELEKSYFRAGGYDVEVKNALLAEALTALTERKRDIILLSYFMEMNDADIARKLNLVRSTVHEHRTRSLEILKIMLEENAGENGRKKRK